MDLSGLATRINAEHAACLAAARDAVTRAIEVGRLLAEAKGQVRHGEWAGWVADRCTFGVRQAQSYMRAYHNREALEGQMRSGDSHLTSLRGAVAMLAEPRESTDLERLEGTIEAGLSELEAMGLSRAEVLPLFAEVMEIIESQDWPDDDANRDRVRSLFRRARQIMESPGWPPGETVEDKLRHVRETLDISQKVQDRATVQTVAFRRELGRLIEAMKEAAAS